MPDDEPLDDARQVGMAAAAAAARVAETLAREARDRAVEHQAMLQRQQDQRRAQETLAGLGLRYGGAVQGERRGCPPGPQRRRQELAEFEFEQAQRWASPERLTAYRDEDMGSDSSDGRQAARDRLVREWKAATAPYDSADRRHAADGLREAAGVPAEAREVQRTADLMRATDPAQAAGAPATTVEAGRTPPRGQQQKTVTRAR